jgi:hypothetical protein
VITGGHHVYAGFENRFSNVAGDSETGGGILDVGDHEVDVMPGDEWFEGTLRDVAAGPAEDVADEKDAHSVGPDRETDLASAPLVDPGEHHAQLSLAQGRSCLAGIDGASNTDGAAEPAERSLRHVKRGIRMTARCGQLRSGNDQRSPGKHQLHSVRFHAGQVHDDLERGRGLDNVERRGAFPGPAGSLGLAVEQIEKTTQFLGHFAPFEINARHDRILRLRHAIRVSEIYERITRIKHA